MSRYAEKANVVGELIKAPRQECPVALVENDVPSTAFPGEGKIGSDELRWRTG